MSKVITAQMLSELPYTSENQVPLEMTENISNLTNVVEVFDISCANYDASATLSKIKENLDELAAIESKENHVPWVRAKEAFTRAIDLQPTLLIWDLLPQYTVQMDFYMTSHCTILSLIEGIMGCVMHKYSNVVVYVDTRRKKLVNFLATILQWEMSHKVNIKSAESSVVYLDRVFSMFVFRSSDLEAATDCLTQAVEDPSGMNRVREVYVQESALDRFKAILQRKLRCYSSEVINDPLLRQSHDEAEKILKKLNATTIRPLNAPEGEVTPVICYEFDMSYFPPNSPVVILKVFRTVKEAVSLATKDKVRNASIWTENFALAYELVNSLDGHYFWINCLGVSCKTWTELSLSRKFGHEQLPKLGSSSVSIENSYHFEYFEGKKFLNFVVFPIGVSFAN